MLIRKEGNAFYVEFKKHVREKSESQGGGTFALERQVSVRHSFYNHLLLSGSTTVFKSAALLTSTMIIARLPCTALMMADGDSLMQVSMGMINGSICRGQIRTHGT